MRTAIVYVKEDVGGVLTRAVVLLAATRCRLENRLTYWGCNAISMGIVKENGL